MCACRDPAWHGTAAREGLLKLAVGFDEERLFECRHVYLVWLSPCRGARIDTAERP